MKDEQIERLLHERPEVPVPPYLHARLRSQISIDRHANTSPIESLWRRWIPAWSFALLMVACLVVIGVQTNQLLQVRSDNRGLEHQVDQQRASMEPSPTLTVDSSSEFA